MRAYSIDDSVFCLHADIDTTELFEGIWPIPNGVSLNSYIVKGDKIAMIDLFRSWTNASDQIDEELASIGVSFAELDYIVLNHLEPDHSGWLASLKRINPGIEIVTTEKGAGLVRSFYKINDGIIPVRSGDSIDLGNGKSLIFQEIPNVHWPETMVSFEPGSGTLFSCDAFGSFGKLGDRVFDDQFDEAEHLFYEAESLRYYANIVSSFSLFVQKAVAKLEGLEVKTVAPSHGIIWRKNPKTIIQRYMKYASYMNGPAEKEICIVWGSMYGNTAKGLEAVVEGIKSEGLPYSIHRVPNEDVSWILADAYKSRGIVIGMPTYEYQMFPPMRYVLDIFARKHVWNRKAFRFGSWGWIGGAEKEFEEAKAPLKWDCLDPVEWPGAPDEETLSLLRRRGKELAKAVKSD